MSKSIILSYAVTVCSEIVEIEKLITFLLKHKRPQDEVVILFDKKNGHEDIPDLVCSLFGEYSVENASNPKLHFYQGDFDNHFADWKNKLTGYCDGDYIFQIDADETPHKNLMTNLPAVLESNIGTEFFWVPRINTVEGLTDADIKKWGWKVDDKGHINFPDNQPRVYKNREGIVWKNKVHEQLEGYNSYTTLPQKEEWCLYHPKDIERQRAQNLFYSTL